MSLHEGREKLYIMYKNLKPGWVKKKEWNIFCSFDSFQNIIVKCYKITSNNI